MNASYVADERGQLFRGRTRNASRMSSRPAGPRCRVDANLGTVPDKMEFKP